MNTVTLRKLNSLTKPVTDKLKTKQSESTFRFALNHPKIIKILAMMLVSLIICTKADGAHWRKTADFQDRSKLIDILTSIASSGRDVGGFAQTPSGHWLLSYDNHVYSSSGFSNQLFNAVKNYVDNGHRVVGADCNDNGSCIVIYENWGHHRIGTMPSGLVSRLNQFRNENWKIRAVEITNSGYVLLGPDKVVGWAGTKNGLGKALEDTQIADRKIRDLSVGFNNEWALIAGHNPMYRDISASLINKLNITANSSRRLRNITIGRNDGYFVYTRGTEASSSALPIAEIEWRLGPDGDTNIWKRMEELEVPGVSITIIEPGTHNPQIAFTRGYGLKKQGEPGGSVLTSTPFALASLSKYLGAVTALSYAWDNGISLNQDIFSQVGPGQIISWRNTGNDNNANDIYGIPDHNLSGTISLRRLLSHTAGFPERPAKRIRYNHFELASNQTSLFWLLGLNCSGSGDVCSLPGDNYVWQENSAGIDYDYSNDGYMVLQAFLEDINDEDIHSILENQLFSPLNMNSANSLIDKSTNYLNKTVWLHSESNPVSNRFAHAQILASNIYSSSADYAKAMIVALNSGASSSGETIIPSNYADQLLERQNYIGGTAPYGFGVNLDNSATEFSDQDFFHGGDFSNAARTFMCGNPTRDEGIVVLLNSGSDKADTLRKEIRRAYIEAVGWPNGVTCN